MPISTKGQLRISLTGNEWLSLAAVVLVAIILGINLVKVVSRANDNYQVYVEEKAALGELQYQNDQLQRELAYYQSYEYKKLYARDNLRLAAPGERLIQIVDQSQTYDVQPEQNNIFSEVEDSSVWWSMLL